MSEGQLDPFLTKTVNDAGLTIFHSVNCGSSEGGNCFVSPVALNFALASICAASEGDTRVQLREILRHRLLGSDHNDRKIHQLYQPFSAIMRNIDTQNGIKMANALWVDATAVKSQGDNLSAYAKHMTEIFGSELHLAGGQDIVNDWAADATANRVNHMIMEQGAIGDGPLLLTSVVSVKANWTSPFDPFNTWPGQFVNDYGEGQLCQFMLQKNSYECSYLKDFRSVSVPCGVNGETAVTFILPNFGLIDDFAKSFTPERWQALRKSRVTEKVRLVVPKLKISASDSSLKDDLQKIGVEDIFDATHADLSRLGESGRFWLSEVLHKAVFQMDESGANSHPGMQDGKFEFSSVGQEIEFRFDRPFLVVSHIEDVIVIVGKVVAPLNPDQK